jgi:sugar lactone lactonase YvrE
MRLVATLWAACLAGCGSTAVPPAVEQPLPPRLTRLDILAGQPGGQGWVDGALVAAHFQEPWALAGDGTSHLYVADANVIRAIDRANGTVTTLAGSYGHPGNSDGVGADARFSLPSGLAFAGGQLYVSDTENETIRKIDVASGAVTTIAGAQGQRGTMDGSAADARFGEPEGIALDGSGNLYISDTDNNTIRVLSLGDGTVATLAGDSTATPGLADGVGTAALFYKPKAMAIDGSGNLYVADAFNLSIRKIVPGTRAVSTLTTFPVGLPQGIAIDGSDLLVSLAGSGSGSDNRIVRVTATGAVSTVAGSAAAQGFVDGPAAAARFSAPAGVSDDGAGTLYIADSGNFVVRAMTIADGTVATYAGALSIGTANGTGPKAHFSAPAGLAVDDAAAYLADTGNDTIRKIVLATGKVTTLAGAPGQSGSADGPAASARFHGPQGLALDPAAQMLYVADTLNRTIRRIDLQAGVVSTPAYTRAPTFGGFDSPTGLALDHGRLFVTDFTDEIVAAIDLQSGETSTFAGQYGTEGTGNGVGVGAGFYGPQGLAADGRGHLYVADTQGLTLRKIDIATATVSTLAGSPTAPGSADGVGAAARFAAPFSVTANGLGDVFVADTYSNTVRHVDVASGTVTTVVGSATGLGVRLGLLPAQLSQPSAVALTATGGLLIVSENAVLIAH